MPSIVLTIVGLVTVVIIPALVYLGRGMRRGGPLVGASVAAAVIAVLWAVYWAALANPHHLKHAALFAVLAVVALVTASFSRQTHVI